MTKETERSERDLAPALTRGLSILDLVAESGEGLSMSDIGRRLGLAKSSVHGLCSVLVNGGVLERDSGGRFRLGLKIVDLARARLEASDLASEFSKRWALLDQFEDEGAIIAVLDGTDVVYVACRNSTKALGITFRIGMRLPARFTATGKAMLSTLPEDDIRKRHKGVPWNALTSNSVANIDLLLKQLEEVRARGYSIDDGETRSHMYSIGAPIVLSESAAQPAGMAISLIRPDVTPEKRQDAIDTVLKLSDELSRSNAYY